MAESLHNLRPAIAVVCPATVATELLVVSDEWLDENLFAFTMTLYKLPDRWYVELDDLANNT